MDMATEFGKGEIVKLLRDEIKKKKENKIFLNKEKKQEVEEMHCVQQISDKIYWIGGNDRRLERFENMFPIPKGVSYNSSIILDEKTAVIDTVDASIRGQYLENIKYLLQDRTGLFSN